MKFTKWLDLQKEGIIIGAVIGAILHYLNFPMINQILNLPELWWHRLAILVLLSSTIGAIGDSIYKPKK